MLRRRSADSESSLPASGPVALRQWKVTSVFDVTNSSPSTEAVDLLACEVLTDLYRAYCGSRPLAVRAYRDEEALLLLLRFEPEAIDDDDPADLVTGMALRAMPGLISSAIEARTGCRLAPGNLSLCSARGLAVFAFTMLDDDGEQTLDHDLFRIEAATLTAERPGLRLVS